MKELAEGDGKDASQLAAHLGSRADGHGEGARYSGLFSVWTPTYKLSLLNLIPFLRFLLCPTYP